MDKSFLNLVEYPFKSNYLQLPSGRMHYVDTGEGEPIVFVHGTPVWSFVYREWIKALSADYRCVAPDHLGFGLSEKPNSGFSYTMEAHAHNLALLLDTLDLENITLVVHDIGGAIGLAQAIARPERIKRIVLMNTWMWDLSEDKAIVSAQRRLSGWFGRFLYTKLNASARWLLPRAFGDKRKLTKNLHKQYTQVWANATEREGLYAVVLELKNANAWWASLWAKRETIAHIPTLILWGDKDPLITPDKRTPWTDLFVNKRVIRFSDVGHFVQEEMPKAALEEIEEFFDNYP
jgi:pimeloyl-ACP methyl ester carboxylesterase